MTLATPLLSVVICTYNPNSERLHRTFGGLRAQTLLLSQWETVLVDNASTTPLIAQNWTGLAPANFRVVRENTPGLSHARQCGLRQARGDIAVLVDDDNILAPDYLETVISLFSRHSQVGVLGGKSLPDFEQNVPDWITPFSSLLALRDLGSAELISSGLRNPGLDRDEYPPFAPIGAGMALRREAWSAWLDARQKGAQLISDRSGEQLTSGGDNDIVLHAMRAGWEVGYFPSLSLTHLIPAARTERAYLGTLNRAIARSWLKVLALHDIRPWQPIVPLTLPLRKVRAWWRTRAWRDSVSWVTWQGRCGTLEGQADLWRFDKSFPKLKSESLPSQRG